MKNTIKVTKKLTVTVDTNLSNIQRIVLKNLSGVNNKLTYLRTLTGDRHAASSNLQSDVRFYRRRFQSRDKTDALAIKKPNTIYNKFLMQFDATTEKRPENNSIGDWIGVEIECFIPYASLVSNHSDENCGTELLDDDGDVTGELHRCDNCRASGAISRSSAHAILANMIKEQKIKGVTVKPDGSINAENGCFPVELCILFKRGDAKPLQSVCNLLNKLKTRVNKSCGLHVHLDARDADTRQATLRGRRLLHALDIFAAMVPKSRRENSYCRLMMNQQKTGTRYAAINLHAYQKFQTIEMRLHSATTDFKKISFWIDILFKTSRSVKMSQRKAASIADFAQKVQLTDAELTYLTSRVEKFKVDTLEESSGVAS